MDYSQQLTVLTGTDKELGSQVAGLPNLEAIVKWARGVGVAFSGIDLVQQDEYSYDLCLPLPDSRWLVFDVS